MGERGVEKSSNPRVALIRTWPLANERVRLGVLIPGPFLYLLQFIYINIYDLRRVMGSPGVENMDPKTRRF